MFMLFKSLRNNRHQPDNHSDRGLLSFSSVQHFQNKIHLLDTLNRDTVVLEGSVISVTARLPRDELYSELMADPESLVASGIKTVRRIGDCFGPATIAAAIYEGHRYAREMDSEIDPDGVPFKLVSYELDLEK